MQRGIEAEARSLRCLWISLNYLYVPAVNSPESEAAVREFIRKDPKNSLSHYTFGLFYDGTGQSVKAIAHYEEAIRLKPDNLSSLFNIFASCNAAGDREKCTHWASVAIPFVERHLKFHPDDEWWLVNHALLLLFSGKTEAAHAAAIELKNLKDANSLYNTACLFGRLGDHSEALGTFRKAIEAGFRDIRVLKEFLTDENEGIAALAGTPEYEEVKRMVEKIEAEAKQ